MRRTQYLILFLIGLFLFISVFSIFSVFILDADGLSVREEFEHNTDPTDNDTDNDGIKDGIEVNKYNTNPNKEDTDNDGLDDDLEIKYNTSPTNPDTDGDSIKDGAEVYNTETYPNADPLQKDVYLEVEYAFSYNKTQVNDTLSPVVTMYADAPVENPDGTTGINLHPQITNSSVSNKSFNVTREKYNNSGEHKVFGNKSNYTIEYVKINASDYKNKIGTSFNHKNTSGYYQVTYVNFICQNGEDCMSTANGLAFINNSSTVIATTESSTTAHEIGHLLGLLHSDYRGIDSEEVHPTDYPSVMNYNYNEHSLFDEYRKDDYNYTLQYSNGEGFNDWKEINQTIANDTRTSQCNCYE